MLTTTVLLQRVQIRTNRMSRGIGWGVEGSPIQSPVELGPIVLSVHLCSPIRKLQLAQRLEYLPGFCYVGMSDGIIGHASELNLQPLSLEVELAQTSSLRSHSLPGDQPPSWIISSLSINAGVIPKLMNNKTLQLPGKLQGFRFSFLGTRDKGQWNLLYNGMIHPNVLVE